MRKSGWLPQTPDFRDMMFSKVARDVVEEPPVKYLICPTTKDQGYIGSCVFNGVTSAMESTDIELRNFSRDYSRLYSYYKYREANNIPIDYDSGATIRDAVKQIAKEGVCLESIWEYNQENFTKKPSLEAEEDAKNHKILEYFALETLTDMVQCIASGWGFVCGISCYTSFDSEYTEKTGKVLLPQTSEKFQGGHCMYFWGYDKHLFDGVGGFHFLNSYGLEWGHKGRGTIPFTYLSNNHLARDFWTIRK